MSTITLAPPSSPSRSFSPAAAWIPWTGLAGFCVLFFIPLMQFWGLNAAYLDRFLIPLASGWVLYRNAHALRILPAAGTRWGLLGIAFGSLTFPMVWYLFVRFGPRALVLWCLAFSWLSLAFGTIASRLGWQAVRIVAFPLLFLLFSLPLPNKIEGPLQHRLQAATTSLATYALQAAARMHLISSSTPISREGFIIHTPASDLGVMEACSGVRSLTALMAIAAFVGYWRGFSLVRGSVLMLLGLGIVILCNVLRVTTTGLLIDNAGPRYGEGEYHEALGFVTVLVGLGLIVAFSSFLRRSGEEDKETRRQGDRETGRQGDRETEGPGGQEDKEMNRLISRSPCLLVSLSPCLLVSRGGRLRDLGGADVRSVGGTDRPARSNRLHRGRLEKQRPSHP